MATGNSIPEKVTRQVGKLTVTVTPDRAEFTRVFDAPRRLVWEAMSKAEHYPHWWGPRSQERVSCELDFRPGGSYRIVTRGSDGLEHAFRGEIREVVPPERVVQTFEYEGMPGTVMLDSLTLIERGGKTVLSTTSTLEAGSPEAVAAMLESGMAEGAAETYDRLEEYLRTPASMR
jgi:uncharacterized protein YndB with AHSA1/START domain